MGTRVLLRQVRSGRRGAGTETRGWDTAIWLPRQPTSLRGTLETVRRIERTHPRVLVTHVWSTGTPGQSCLS